MACAKCSRLIDAPRDDREKSELDGVFAILEEKVDKYDSCTMWWYGRAECASCKQRVRFEYMQGGQNYGEVKAE